MSASTSKPTKAKKGEPIEGLDVGDTVYVRHPQRGVATVDVLAVGKDGFTGQDDEGKRVKVKSEAYLGHKARLMHTYSVVDEGLDGFLLERDDGQKRYLPGGLQKALGETPPKPVSSDPLIASLDDMLGKALRPLPSPAAWLLKAVTGQRTARIAQATNRKPRAKPDARKAKPLHKHGDVVRFRHDDVEGEGVIVASGQDGVTVRDDTGREHKVRHDALLPPNEDDKQARAVAKDAASDAPAPPARATKRAPKPQKPAKRTKEGK